jgi:hypothetical protein
MGLRSRQLAQDDEYFGSGDGYLARLLRARRDIRTNLGLVPWFFPSLSARALSIISVTQRVVGLEPPVATPAAP